MKPTYLGTLTLLALLAGAQTASAQWLLPSQDDLLGYDSLKTTRTLDLPAAKSPLSFSPRLKSKRTGAELDPTATVYVDGFRTKAGAYEGALNALLMGLHKKGVMNEDGFTDVVTARELGRVLPAIDARRVDLLSFLGDHGFRLADYSPPTTIGELDSYNSSFRQRRPATGSDNLIPLGGGPLTKRLDWEVGDPDYAQMGMTTYAGGMASENWLQAYTFARSRGTVLGDSQQVFYGVVHGSSKDSSVSAFALVNVAGTDTRMAGPYRQETSLSRTVSFHHAVLDRTLVDVTFSTPVIPIAVSLGIAAHGDVGANYQATLTAEVANLVNSEDIVALTLSSQRTTLGSSSLEGAYARLRMTGFVEAEVGLAALLSWIPGFDEVIEVAADLIPGVSESDIRDLLSRTNFGRAGVEVSADVLTLEVPGVAYMGLDYDFVNRRFELTYQMRINIDATILSNAEVRAFAGVRVPEGIDVDFGWDPRDWDIDVDFRWVEVDTVLYETGDRGVWSRSFDLIDVPTTVLTFAP